MCAAVAGQRGRKVLLIEHADEPGKKISFLVVGAAISPICILRRIAIFPPIRISPNPHSAGIPPRISSEWWTGTTLPGTKKPSGSYSAMEQRARSSRGHWRSALKDLSRCCGDVKLGKSVLEMGAFRIGREAVRETGVITLGHQGA